MIITNRTNQPEPLVRAVSFDGHRRADYSVSDLVTPGKIVLLRRRHDAEITIDVLDLLTALWGKAVHSILSTDPSGRELTEEYLTYTANGVTLSGSPDIIDNDGVLTDYKTGKVWSWIYKSSWKQWEQQINCYSYLYANAGFEATKLQICMIFTDYMPSKQGEQNYPPERAVIIPMEKWPVEKQHQFIIDRLTVLELQKTVPDDTIPECTPEERWQTSDTYAVIKDGNKVATKLFIDKSEAEALAANIEQGGRKCRIDFRPGTAKRCETCEVRPFCHYGKNIETREETNV